LFLADRIASAIAHFEHSARDVMTMQLGAACAPFEQGQADIYREVRRAREHNRPLSLVAISASGKSSSVEFNKLLQEVQHNAVEQYMQGRLARLVAHCTKDCDILVRDDDHLVLVLPEADSDIAQKLSTRLQDEARNELGLQLRLGAASFPNEEVTFSGLLQRAADNMRLENETIASETKAKLQVVRAETAADLAAS
jgi:hypothetical protein